MDERSQKIIAGGMGITLALLYFGLFVLCIWKYVTTGDITNSTWELILIVMIPASILWFSRKDVSLMIPKMSGTTGQELPTENDFETKQKRKKSYIWDSIGLAAVFLVLDIVDSLFIQKDWSYFNFLPQLSGTLNMVTSLFLEFILSVLVFYAISFIWGEWQIKKYNRKLEKLEDDDE